MGTNRMKQPKKRRGGIEMNAIEIIKEVDEGFRFSLLDYTGMGDGVKYVVSLNGHGIFSTRDKDRARARFDELKGMLEDFKSRVEETLSRK